ncbi:MAG: hypothetical protein ABL977_11025 [Candidatus Eisenbacteria bacterium]
MRRTHAHHPKPHTRALALAFPRAFGERLLWAAAAVLTLVGFVVVREAVGDAAPRTAADAAGADRGAEVVIMTAAITVPPAAPDAIAPLGRLRPLPLADHTSTDGGLTQEHALPHRATLRAAERARRAAGRTGISARRDSLGSSAVVVTADAALARPRGAAPEHAGHLFTAPRRDTSACGVRGPPVVA